MIDWTNKDSLRRRGNKDVRAVEVHSLPDWIKGWCRHYVKWSDGRVCVYRHNGMYLDSHIHDNDVITAPRSGEGWIRKNDGGSGVVMIEQIHALQAAEYIRVRWEEVLDD